MRKRVTQYPRKQLGEVLEFFNGKAIKPGGVGAYPVFGSNGLIGGSDECRYSDGIVIGRVGAYCGSVEYCAGRFWASDNTIVAKPKNEREYSRYFYYLLKNAKLNRYAGGSAQPLLTQANLARVTLPIAPLRSQEKIVGVLAAYDDLIENNGGRIRILEEIARAIYREWFVEFRAPGVKLRRASVNEAALTGRTTFPEDWMVRPMEDVADVVDCLHSKKPSENPSGSGMLLQLFNIGENGKLDVARRYLISDSDYKEWSSRIEVHAGDCIVTNVGRVGAVAQIPEGVSAALGRNMTAVRPRPALISAPYLFEYLLSSYMATETARKKDMGTIMDALNVKGIVRLEVPVPSLAVLEAFDAMVGPIHRRIQMCARQSVNLRSTRDLLLPRLTSGDVSVEHLNIAPAEQAVEEVAEVSN